MNKFFIKTLPLCLGVLVLTFALSYLASAWTEPTVAPPGGNVDTPLNVGIYGQSKAGGLMLNTGNATTGLIVATGTVGIGTKDPKARLDVAQNSAIKVGQAYLSSGGDYTHLANNEWFDGTAWQATAPGALIQLSGQNTAFYRHDASGGHTLSMTIDANGNVGVSGDLNLQNQILRLNGVMGAPGQILVASTGGKVYWANQQDVLKTVYDSLPLVNSAHSINDCINAQGTIEDVGDSSFKMCHFILATPCASYSSGPVNCCPPGGWKQYESYSACKGYPTACHGTVADKSWGNASYCASCSGSCFSPTSCPEFAGAYIDPHWPTVGCQGCMTYFGNVTEIGCY